MRNALKHTDLTSNDRGPHNQQHQLVEQRVQEPNHRLQLGGVERRDAGLELRLQVVFHDAHVSYPDWKHVLVQSVYQGKELVQVLVLNSEMGWECNRGEKNKDCIASFITVMSNWMIIIL